MMEGSHLLGLMLVLLAGAWLLQKRTWRRYALLGACIGFAIAAKHPNVLPSALVFVACLAMPLWQFAREKRRNWHRLAQSLRGLLLTGLAAILVFLALNPAWWSAPLEVPGVVVELRRDLLHGQVARVGRYDSWADQISRFFQFVFVGERQYFESPGREELDIVASLIRHYEGSGLAGFLAYGESLWLGYLALALSLCAPLFARAQRKHLR